MNKSSKKKILIAVILAVLATAACAVVVDHTDENEVSGAEAFSPGTPEEPLWDLKCSIEQIHIFFEGAESPKMYISVRSNVEIKTEPVYPIQGVEDYPGLSLSPQDKVVGEVSKIGSFDLSYQYGLNQDIFSVEIIVVDYVDSDFGDFYSNKLSLSYTGEGATSILWDFGDGTTSTEWEPEHVYAEKGTYYIKQTASNSAGDSVAVYKINIMGYPVITFNANGGTAVADIAQTSPSAVAVAPTDPVRDGYVFEAWYTDEALTVPYDWATEVEEHMTLYAKWTTVLPTYTITLDAADGEVAENTLSVTVGGSVALPVPTRDGFTFDGWYAGDVKVDAEAFTATGDVTLIAYWTETPGTDSEDPTEFRWSWLVCIFSAVAISACAVIWIRL